MNSRQLNLLLFNSIPEIKDSYEKAISWQDGHGTGSHVIFGDVLGPYVEDRVIQGDLEAIKRVLVFIEVVLEMDDEYAGNVIEVSFLENFFYKKEFRSLIERELGPRAAAVWKRIAEAPWAPKPNA